MRVLHIRYFHFFIRYAEVDYLSALPHLYSCRLRHCLVSPSLKHGVKKGLATIVVVSLVNVIVVVAGSIGSSISSALQSAS